jgi:hypothetical protein
LRDTLNPGATAVTGISARLVSTASMFLFSLGVHTQGPATPAANHDPETAVISTADLDSGRMTGKREVNFPIADSIGNRQV